MVLYAAVRRGRLSIPVLLAPSWIYDFCALAELAREEKWTRLGTGDAGAPGPTWLPAGEPSLQAAAFVVLTKLTPSFPLELLGAPGSQRQAAMAQLLVQARGKSPITCKIGLFSPYLL
jgi:hypothetical protein